MCIKSNKERNKLLGDIQGIFNIKIKVFYSNYTRM